MIAASRRTRLALVVAAMAAVAACSSATSGDGRPATISLSADSTTTTAGSKLVVRFKAAGSYLDAIYLDFDDGTTDSIPVYGSSNAEGQRTHTWETAGTYTVRGEVVDLNGSASAQLTITVRDAGS